MKKRTIFAMALSLAMADPAVILAAPAYQPAHGDACSFDSYLVLKKDAEIPNVTFRFSIKPGQAIPYSEGHMEVLAPSAEDMPVMRGDNASESDTDRAYVTFQPGDPVTNEELKAAGETVNFMNMEAAGTGTGSDEKYTKHALIMDFSSVMFAEPGVYRYILTQDDPQIQGLDWDKGERTLDVYVEDQNGSLLVTSYVLHTNTDAPVTNFEHGTFDAVKEGDDKKADSDLADKSSGFTNRYLTWNSTVRKEVTGNQGSKDKYFKIHMAVGGEVGATVRDSDRFMVDISKAEEAPEATPATVYSSDVMKEANSAHPADFRTPKEFVTGKELKAGHDFYLKDGQAITIQGLPDNTHYTYSEENEDYMEQDVISRDVATDAVDYSAPLSANLTSDIRVGFTNTRNGIIPTGVMMKIAIPAALMIIGLLGAIALVFRKKSL